ncbi:MAG: ParA family protein [Acidobacteriota bacterium]
MRRIAITNLKGGVGKTTTAVNLAAGLARRLAERGERILLIDLDPQTEASASSWLGAPEGSRLFLEVLQDGGELFDLVWPTGVPGLDLVPGHPSLARAEAMLAGEPGSETVLGLRVRALPPRWTVAIIDTPPAQGWLMHSALTAASDVLVAVESGAMALGSLVGLDRVIRRVRDRLNPELSLFGVLQCRADTRTRLHREVDELLRSQFGDEAFRAVIRSDVRLLEAPGHRRDIFDYAPSSRAAADFTALCREVAERLELELP